MSDREQAQALLGMAEKDLKALVGMTDSEIFVEEVFGFHAQQAIEKALKAWMALLSMEYPFTHDISHLLRLLTDRGCATDLFWPLIEYNAFAVQFRYEAYGEDEDPLDRMKTIEEVQRLVIFIRKIMEETRG